MSALDSVGSVAALRGLFSTGERPERYDRERKCDGLEGLEVAGVFDFGSSAVVAVPDRGLVLELLVPF